VQRHGSDVEVREFPRTVLREIPHRARRRARCSQITRRISLSARRAGNVDGRTTVKALHPPPTRGPDPPAHARRGCRAGFAGRGMTFALST